MAWRPVPGLLVPMAPAVMPAWAERAVRAALASPGSTEPPSSQKGWMAATAARGGTAVPEGRVALGVAYLVPKGWTAMAAPAAPAARRGMAALAFLPWRPGRLAAAVVLAAMVDLAA